MKKLQYYILIALCFSMATCTEDDAESSKIMVGKNVIEFEAEGGINTVEVRTKGGGILWYIESAADWCELDSYAGVDNQVVSVELKPNTEGKERETNLVITSSHSDDIYIKVKQKHRYATQLSVSPDNLDIPTNGYSYVISVEADAYWKVENVPDWISLNKTEGFGSNKIVVSKWGDESGTGKFSITAQDKTVDIAVKKWGKEEAYIITNGADKLDGLFFSHKLYNVTKKLKISGLMSTTDFSAIKKMLLLEDLDITDIRFYSGVSALPPYALWECKFQSIELPKGLLSINSGAFSACIMLKQVDIPEGVVSVGSFVFSFCSALESVTLPSTLKSIDHGAFSQCTNLKKIYIKNPEPPVSADIIDYTAATACTLYVPKGSKAKYQNATNWSEFKNIVEE